MRIVTPRLLLRRFQPTFSGHEGLTSTSLANDFVTSAINGAASMTAEEMAIISTYP